MGETVKTESYELTLTDAQIGNCYFDHDLGHPTSWWSTSSIKVQIFVTIKNLDKQEVSAMNAISFSVDYNNGYIYSPGSWDTRFGKTGAYKDTLTYSSKLSPLGSFDYSAGISVPEEVYTNQNIPLYVVLQLWDGSEYRYLMTQDNYNPLV